jgi:hypothetical protein
MEQEPACKLGWERACRLEQVLGLEQEHRLGQVPELELACMLGLELGHRKTSLQQGRQLDPHI